MLLPPIYEAPRDGRQMIKVRLSLTVNALAISVPLVRSLVLGRSLSIGTSSGLLGRVCSAGVLGVGGIARVLLYPKLDKYEGVRKSSASPDENTTL